MRDWFASFFKDLSIILLVLALVALPVALLLSHVHTQYTIAQAGYDIARVTREHHKLAESSKKLRIEAAVQGRTQRMTQLATQRFGLSPARPEQITIIHLGEDAEPERHASLEATR